MNTLNSFGTKNLFYIRALVYDKPGAIAALTSILRDFNISIKSLFQKQLNKNSFNVVILTQNIDFKSINKALSKLNKCKYIKEKPKILQVLHI